LNTEQRDAASFDVDSIAWRQWSKIHFFLMRRGAFLDELTPAQRDNAMTLLKESLRPKGYQTARDIMRLNESILEITGKTDEYGEWLYWMILVGTPSSDESWGWQIDGHHLIINYFIVNERAIISPAFMGSEPNDADAIHSPIILIEFDYQRGVALDTDKPTKDHIHTVVRTLNGNDYSKGLLRQHREDADASHGHKS